MKDKEVPRVFLVGSSINSMLRVNVAAITNLVVDACQRLGMKLSLGVGPYRMASFGTDRVLRRVYKRNSEAFDRPRSLRNVIAATALTLAFERRIELLDRRAFTVRAPSPFTMSFI